VAEVTGMRERAQEFQDNPELVKNLLAEGAEKARESARATLDDVRRAMHLRSERCMKPELKSWCPIQAGRRW
jgi:hypothetical protein